jgi:mannose-6-phosphate isomerase-like protein (cupin superfamily)
MKPNYHISLYEAAKLLNKENNRFVEVMEDGKMIVEYYAPKLADEQEPHMKDELYVIASGSSGFYRNGETIECKQGDVIFVPAHMEHRFINFSDDFATWVIFYGDEIY